MGTYGWWFVSFLLYIPPAWQHSAWWWWSRLLKTLLFGDQGRENSNPYWGTTIDYSNRMGPDQSHQVYCIITYCNISNTWTYICMYKLTYTVYWHKKIERVIHYIYMIIYILYIYVYTHAKVEYVTHSNIYKYAAHSTQSIMRWSLLFPGSKKSRDRGLDVPPGHVTAAIVQIYIYIYDINQNPQMDK